MELSETTILIEINGIELKADVIEFKIQDREILKNLYEDWDKFRRDMKLFHSRPPIIPEGLSESAFCIYHDINCVRKKHVHAKNNIQTSFDLYNVKTGKRIQIKASANVNGYVSFGLRNVWDELYFLDFYKSGEFDGYFDIYSIPNNILFSWIVNKKKNLTFIQQQLNGIRPQVYLKRLVIKNNLSPIGTYKIN